MISMIKAGDLVADNREMLDPSRHINEAFDLYSVPAFERQVPDVATGKDIGSAKQAVKPKDVLLCKIVPHIRRAWIVGEKKRNRQIASSEWLIFRDKRFCPEYLRHYLVSDRFHQVFMQTVSGVGGSLLRARPVHVAQIKIPLPPLDEQRRIAAILDKADAIRRKRCEAIRLLDDFLRATFLDMFGDPVINPKGWPMGTVGDMAADTQYGTSMKAAASGAYPYLRMGNITYAGGWDFADMKYIDLSEQDETRYLVKKGEVLFNRTNSRELVGKTAVFRLDTPMAFAGYLIKLTVNAKGNSEYLAAAMNSQSIKEYLRSKCKNIVGMANINAREFRDVPLPLPPMTIQNRYADIVQTSEKKKETLIRHASESESLFSSLQSRAFKGEL